MDVHGPGVMPPHQAAATSASYAATADGRSTTAYIRSCIRKSLKTRPYSAASATDACTVAYWSHPTRS
jgi:hypothetical protein